MKKILTGCLIVAVIAMIGLGVAAFYAYRLAKPMIDNAGSYVAKAREISRLGDRVVNRAPYVPPKNGELTAAQVDRFLAVQTRVRSELGDRWDEIETRTAEISKKTEGQEHLALSEVSSIFSELANIYIDARRAQVVALNTHKFSDGEYNWVRRRVWEATGIHMASGLDMSAIEDLKLIKPHTAKLKEWIPLAVLGL
jgi:hypothetical protein